MYESHQQIMKIPFYTVVGPLLRRNKQYINTVCSHPALAFAPFYVGILGVLGVFFPFSVNWSKKWIGVETLLSIFDIVRIIRCGPILPGYLWRERLKNGKFVAPEVERDCKLISLVLSIEYYFFLVVGLLTNNPIFYMPFLLLYAIIITLECIIFLTRTFVDGLQFQKGGILMTMFMVYNWLTVACTFARSMSCCDL